MCCQEHGGGVDLGHASVTIVASLLLKDHRPDVEGDPERVPTCFCRGGPQLEGSCIAACVPPRVQGDKLLEPGSCKSRLVFFSLPSWTCLIVSPSEGNHFFLCVAVEPTATQVGRGAAVGRPGSDRLTPCCSRLILC